MPAPLIKRHRQLRSVLELTGWQRMEFVIGDAGHRRYFANEAERRAAWEAHRGALMRHLIPGHRIAGWWWYESPEPRNYDGEHETLQLLRLGVVDDGELTQLRAEWAQTVYVIRLNTGTPAGESLPVEDNHLWGVPGWFIKESNQRPSCREARRE